VHNFFQKKDNQKERIARRVWALVIMVSVSNRLVTLILFIVAISLSGRIVCHGENVLKDFSELSPNQVTWITFKFLAFHLLNMRSVYGVLFKLW
jgi:hypothetical protein